MDENRLEGTARNLGGKAQDTISIHRRYGDALPGRAARQLPINRQLSGWNLPLLMIRAFGAHGQKETFRGVSLRSQWDDQNLAVSTD
jgi:hypothetical protein